MARTYHLTLPLLVATWIKNLTTGRHMTVASNLRLRISYFAEIRCPLGTSTLYLASGLRLLPSIMTNHHFRRLRMFTTLSIQLLLAMSPGNPLAYSIMESGLKRTFHRGCKLNMMSDSGIHAFWFATSCQIPISSLTSIMRHSKSAQVMEPIASKTSCLEIGLGIKQWVVL